MTRYPALPHATPHRARRAAALRCAAALLALGCHASVQADAQVSGASNGAEEGEAGEPVKRFDRPLESPARAPEPPADDGPTGSLALLGARHDLAYAGPKTPTCACLAVALSDLAQDPAFAWEMEPPRLQAGSQWIIALSSSEVPCETPPSGTLGASYQGYGVEGNDVIVFVEALGEGRPLTSGAVIPKPKPSGGVYIEPTNAVYGKPLDGKSRRCPIAPPGAPKG